MEINAKMLSNFRLFKECPEKDINLYLVQNSEKFSIITLEKNSILINSKDKLDKVYIVLSGELYASMISPTGKKIRISTIQKGEIVASAFLFSSTQFSPVTVISNSKTYILTISKSNFLLWVSSMPKLLENFLLDISSRTETLSQKLRNELYGFTIEEKVNNYICEKRVGDIIKFKPTLTAVSEFFGVERPSLSRVMSKLVKDGVLEKISNSEFRILDEEFFKRESSKKD